MTGPQPHRDYPPRESRPVRICWWIVSAVIAITVCGIVWIAANALADVVWEMLEVIG